VCPFGRLAAKRGEFERPDRMRSSLSLAIVVAAAATLSGCGTFSFIDNYTTSFVDRPAGLIGKPAATEAFVSTEQIMPPERTASVATTASVQTASLDEAVPSNEPAVPQIERYVQPSAPAEKGHVYLFRGMGGRIASLDLDRMADKLNKAGVKAGAYNFVNWRGPADEAIARYKRETNKSPIIVVGHSAGGDAALSFAERLKEAQVPVSLIVAFDPTRRAGRVPANVDRFVNIYQSLNFFGGGDVTPASDFHGHFASVDLKRYWEVLHVNLVKLEGLQDKVIEKIVRVATLSSDLEGVTVPIKYVMPRNQPIELWDSGLPIRAEAGDTVRSLAAKFAVPAWSVAQLNNVGSGTSFKPGQRVVIPRHLEAGPSHAETLTSFAPHAR
jgi:pimeloyl-ACP methyl ester carboxylesterase